MKRLLVVLSFFVAAVSAAASFPALVPAPAAVRGAAGSCPVDAPLCVVRVAPSGLFATNGAYRISVASTGVVVTAATDAGAFYARRTLDQLGAGGAYPCCEIDDAPRYSWRGVLLDESRHFFGAAVVKRLLDRMAAFKLNVFHWHLSDDQGWRVEIKSRPRLTTVGAERPMPDWSRHVKDPEVGRTPRQFYTQDEIRAIVAYAAARHIRVVPEIDVPGHSRAAILAYPFLSCLERSDFFDKMRIAAGEGRCTSLCLGKDETLAFYDAVFDEICSLFPDEIIHIGGDECSRENWLACARCRARMKAEGLADGDALQSWFTKRLVACLAKRGKRALGWDEILKGGVAPGALVMSWRGTAGGIAAANAGHEVVMCPHELCYLDYRTGFVGDICAYPNFVSRTLSLESVYSLDPCGGIPEDKRRFVLGTESLNWSEATWCEKDLEFKMWPRTCANAEIAWTGAGVRTFADFAARLVPIAARLRAAGVNAAEFRHDAAPADFHLYLLAGQSNMAGRGKLDWDTRVSCARLLKLDASGAWQAAVEPIHFDKPTAGAGLAASFGRAMADRDKRVTIGLVPCAVGGSPIARWQPGADLYVAAVARARRAMKDGTLKGVLWHQGCSDVLVAEEDKALYAQRLRKTFEGFRRDLGDVPIVCGELGPYLDKTPGKALAAHWRKTNEVLHELAAAMPRVVCVSAEGLAANADNLHFDTPSLRLFGLRYAEAMAPFVPAAR